jgi:DNA-binding IclR family transcriptional regulator
LLTNLRLAPSFGRVSLSKPLDLDSLERELEEIRRRGYAKSDLLPGFVSFAAPIMGQADRAVAALTVSAAAVRLTPERRAQLIEQLLVACSEIAECFGHLARTS